VGDTDHHIGRLDDGECFPPDFQTELVDGRVGDGRRHDDPAADFNLDVRGRCTLGHLDDLALGHISRADLHVGSPLLMSRCTLPGRDESTARPLIWGITASPGTRLRCVADLRVTRATMRLPPPSVPSASTTFTCGTASSSSIAAMRAGRLFKIVLSVAGTAPV